MPFFRFSPDAAVHLSDMPLDTEWWRSWTRQPGKDGELLHVEIVGPGAQIELANATVAADERKIDVPMLQSGNLGTVVKLRDYQEAAITAVGNSWSRGKRAPLIVLPTASGKTIVSADLIARVHAVTRGKAIFLAHRQELLSQTIAKIRLVSPETRVGLMKASTLELGREVTVASIQTIAHPSGTALQRLLDHGPYRLLVIDEAHHAVAPEWLRVIAKLKDANPDMLLMGMTATPGREDGTALDLVFDDVAYERGLIEMIREGWLVPPRAFRVTIDVDLDNVKMNAAGEYVKSSLASVMNSPPVNAAVVRAWCEYGHDRKMLVYAVDIAHTLALAEEFNASGYSAGFVHGKMKPKEREAALQKFRDGSYKLLVSCETLTEGYDDPSAEGVVLARPTQSQSLFIQILGRALRLYPGKTEALVIDCVGNSLKHQPVQLASLSGFEPEKELDEPEAVPPYAEEDEDGPVVIDANIRGEEVQLYRRKQESKYTWRETTFGWILQIPRVGYYLVAWSDKAKRLATIRFFDQRPGKRDSLPREILHDPVDFEMAYGLVEGECDRFFRARSKRKDGDDAFADDNLTASSFIDLDEGTDEDTSLGPESWILKDAAWRTKPISASQFEFLEKLGVKLPSMPETSGEASDLITVLRAAKDQKMRVPATQKQIAYLYANAIPIPPNMTKGAAASIIWQHRKVNNY